MNLIEFTPLFFQFSLSSLISCVYIAPCRNHFPINRPNQPQFLTLLPAHRWSKWSPKDLSKTARKGLITLSQNICPAIERKNFLRGLMKSKTPLWSWRTFTQLISHGWRTTMKSFIRLEAFSNQNIIFKGNIADGDYTRKCVSLWHVVSCEQNPRPVTSSIKHTFQWTWKWPLLTLAGTSVIGLILRTPLYLPMQN